MVKQYDIIKLNLNPVQGSEKGDYRPCLVASESEFTQVSGFAWVIPITKREYKRYPTDVIVETENNAIYGVVDCAHIRAVDLHARSYREVDVLTDNKIHEVNDVIVGILNI